MECKTRETLGVGLMIRQEGKKPHATVMIEHGSETPALYDVVAAGFTCESASCQWCEALHIRISRLQRSFYEVVK